MATKYPNICSEITFPKRNAQYIDLLLPLFIYIILLPVLLFFKTYKCCRKKVVGTTETSNTFLEKNMLFPVSMCYAEIARKT